MIHRNLCLVGPPGSGKGSYGRHLAKVLGIPLVTSSDLLRKSSKSLDLSSGKLVDDADVSTSLLDGLQEYRNGYILDGFPRTLKQAHMMEDTWPIDLQVEGAIKLAVADKVCKVKLLGRRICKKCNGNYNVNGVDFDGWYMPPSLPSPCPHDNCNPEKDWTSRPDDRPSVVEERLSLYHKHMDPILGYFENQNRLLKLTPYNGYDDLPEMITRVKKWLKELED